MRRQSLELLPDAAGSARVRRDWQLLRDAGLPSLLDHTGATNAPHVTVMAVPDLDDDARARAAELFEPLLPAACLLTGLVVLGVRRRVVARLVEVPDALVAAVLALRAETDGHPFPGWLPHVTLAHGLEDRALTRAVEVLDPSPQPFLLASLRHWKPSDGSVTRVAGAEAV